MQTIEIIYLTATCLSVASSFPQIKQLWVLKNSDEFSLFTWSAWFAAQISALFYSIYIKSIPYLVVNICWIAFYVMMLWLIIRYKQPKEFPVADEVAAE